LPLAFVSFAALQQFLQLLSSLVQHQASYLREKKTTDHLDEPDHDREEVA
jgi:phenylalanine-4-hydroxylase